MHKNPVTWWEMASADAGKTVEFLKRAFEWEMDFEPSLNYHQRTVEDTRSGFCGGGIYQVEEGKRPSVIIYFRVDDVDKSAKSVVEAGGALIEGPFDVPNLGRLCIFEDPTGQRFGMIRRLWE
jgi:predicted enzyme related to lactoylglutathione lyase